MLNDSGRFKEQVRSELAKTFELQDFRLQGRQPPFDLVVKSSAVQDKTISVRDLVETHRRPVGIRLVSITLEARNS